MSRPFTQLTTLVAGLCLTGAVACSDVAPTGPTALEFSTPAAELTTIEMTSRPITGDTAVTVFVVGSGQLTVNIGNLSRIEFPYGMASICDPTRSSYGPGTWDSPCSASRKSITITAKTWVNAAGKLQSDFQPALRFVPSLLKPVTLYLKDAALAGTRIDFCTPTGCINEALTDPSVTTILDPNNGKAFRTIKHFSGYTVTAD